ncbi:MAG: S8 family peptidase, partial [Bosea sp. (in: a-proteobacteria)]
SYKNYYRAGDRFSFKGDDPLNGIGLVAPQFHGTHVAGIVAANRDGTGMHGVAFNARLFAAITSDPGPEDGVVAGNDANAYRAGFTALKASGVRIINNSWGIGFLGNLGAGPSTRASQTDTIQQYFSAPNDGTINATAATARSGILLVKSTGNKFGSEPDAIGALPYFRPDLEDTSITAANLSGDALSSSSSICGMTKYYCISAPGTSIISARYFGDKDENSPGYTAASGTSMSAPMIAGSLALLMERFPYM